MAEIQFAQKPTDAYGKEVKVDSNDETTATLGKFCIIALDALLQGDETGKPSERFMRGMLARDIAKAETEIKQLELSAEQIALLKDRVAKCFASGSLVGSIWLMLDPASKGI